MEPLKCFMCHNTVKGGLNGLARHFTVVHGLTLKHRIDKVGFQCGQKDCSRKFLYFYSLRDHIRKIHLSRKENYDFSAEKTESTSSYDNIIIYENDTNKISENLNNVEVLKICDDFHLRYSLKSLIIRLQSNVSMTGSIITNILDEYKQMTNKLFIIKN